jgi:GPH family glycoside/pentoside/hexuronide:cation symporter/glucuronide carrier protein
MAEGLRKSVLYTYGVADLFFLLVVNLEMFYFAMFLTDYAQFSMATVSIILWITGIFDTACAFVAGIILQNTNLKFGGKYRSWFLIGPPIVAPLFLLQFSRIGGELSAAVLITSGFLFSHLLWNVVFTASGAMVGRLSKLPDEVTMLSTNRAQGMSAGALIFSVTAGPMIAFFSARTGSVMGFTLAGASYAILMILGYWYVYKITSGKDPYDEVSTASARQEAGPSVKELARLVLENPPLLLLSAAEMFRNTGVAIGTAFAVYYFKYVANDLPFMSVFLLANSIAGLIGSFAATWTGLRFGKRISYWLFLVLAAMASIAARFWGTTLWGFTTIISVSVMFGVIPGSMSTALYSDTIIYGHWKTGKNIRAFTMSVSNIPIKLGILLRSATVTLGLAAVGYVSNASPTPGVVDGITSLITLAPAVTYLLAAVILYFGYRIEDRHVLQMQNEIAAAANR